MYRSKHDTKQTGRQPEPGSDVIAGSHRFTRGDEFTGSLADRFTQRLSH